MKGMVKGVSEQIYVKGFYFILYRKNNAELKACLEIQVIIHGVKLPATSISLSLQLLMVHQRLWTWTTEWEESFSALEGALIIQSVGLHAGLSHFIDVGFLHNSLELGFPAFWPEEKIHCCGNWYMQQRGWCGWLLISKTHKYKLPQTGPHLAEWILQKSSETTMTNDSAQVMGENDIFC